MATEEVGIRLTLRDRRDVARGLQQTQGDVRGIGDEAERTGRRSERAFAVLKRAGSAVGTTAKVGTGLLLAAGTAAAGYGVKMAAANEQAGISFGVMLGGAQAAQSFLGKLAAFAEDTPFTLPGLRDSAAQLISAGIEASKVIPIMRTLGDATSAKGTGAEGIQRATVALQQMNAAGKISAEDLNQLRDAGVNVYEVLAAATGKSTEAVAALVDKGKLGRKELGQLMTALESGKGFERFNGLMEKQSHSLTGMWSAFTEKVSGGLGKALDPWVPTLKMALGHATKAAGPFFDILTAKSTELAKHGPYAVNMVTRALRAAGPYLSRASAWVGSLVANMRSGEGVDMSAVRDLGASAGVLVQNLPALTAQLPSINDALRVGGVVAGFLADHIDTLAYLMPVIASGFVIWKAAQIAGTAAAIADLPVRAAELSIALLQANANRALAFQIGLLTGEQVRSRTAVVAGMAVSAAQRVGTIASAAATGVQTAAMGVATGAQWLWNAAMTANPIGLIVLAVVAVGAAIYGMVKGVQYAYKHWGWFKTAVDATWQALQKAWEWVKKAGSAVGKFFGGGGSDKATPAVPATGTAVSDLPGRARGGPVNPHQAYQVGERGPELFQPRVPGVIIPKIPQARTDLDGALVQAMHSRAVNVSVQIDRREVARAVADDWNDQAARK